MILDWGVGSEGDWIGEVGSGVILDWGGVFRRDTGLGVGFRGDTGWRR